MKPRLFVSGCIWASDGNGLPPKTSLLAAIARFHLIEDAVDLRRRATDKRGARRRAHRRDRVVIAKVESPPSQLGTGRQLEIAGRQQMICLLVGNDENDVVRRLGGAAAAGDCAQAFGAAYVRTRVPNVTAQTAKYDLIDRNLMRDTPDWRQLIEIRVRYSRAVATVR